MAACYAVWSSAMNGTSPTFTPRLEIHKHWSLFYGKAGQLLMTLGNAQYEGWWQHKSSVSIKHYDYQTPAWSSHLIQVNDLTRSVSFFTSLFILVFTYPSVCLSPHLCLLNVKHKWLSYVLIYLSIHRILSIVSTPLSTPTSRLKYIWHFHFPYRCVSTYLSIHLTM